jgi:hypothetical protein
VVPELLFRSLPHDGRISKDKIEISAKCLLADEENTLIFIG